MFVLDVGHVAQLFGEELFVVQIFGRPCLGISEIHVLVGATATGGGRGRSCVGGHLAGRSGGGQGAGNFVSRRDVRGRSVVERETQLARQLSDSGEE